MFKNDEEFSMSDWTEEPRLICFSHSSSCLDTNVCMMTLCVCVACTYERGVQVWLSISERRWAAPPSPSAALRISAGVLFLSPSAFPRLPAGPDTQTEWHQEMVQYDDATYAYCWVIKLDRFLPVFSRKEFSCASKFSLPLVSWESLYPLVSLADWRSVALWPTAPPGGQHCHDITINHILKSFNS